MKTRYIDDVPEAPVMSAEIRDRKMPVLLDRNALPIDPFSFGLTKHILDHRFLAAAHFRHLANAYIFNDVIFIDDVDRGFRPLESNWRAIDQPPRGPDFLDLASQAIMKGSTRDIRQGFYIGSAGSSNYGHWLVDDLPRAVLARERRPAVPYIFTSFSTDIDTIKVETLNILRPEADHYSIDRLDLVFVRDLFFVDPISTHPILKSRAALETLRSVVIVQAKDTPKRIFVNRRGSREIANFDTIELFLRAHGFVVVNAEDHTFQEQVDLFSNAEVVIGIMGAAMTNIIFCKTTVSLLFLCPEGWEEPFYWDLCDTLGLRYVAMFGKAISVSHFVHLANFEIEHEPFKKAFHIAITPQELDGGTDDRPLERFHLTSAHSRRA